MGMYDTYGKVQLKVGPRTMQNYKLRDKVPIKDGVYLGPEGKAVVIVGGHFVALFKELKSKWNNTIAIEPIVEKINPYIEVIKLFKEYGVRVMTPDEVVKAVTKPKKGARKKPKAKRS